MRVSELADWATEKQWCSTRGLSCPYKKHGGKNWMRCYILHIILFLFQNTSLHQKRCVLPLTRITQRFSEGQYFLTKNNSQNLPLIKKQVTLRGFFWPARDLKRDFKHFSEYIYSHWLQVQLFCCWHRIFFLCILLIFISFHVITV